MIQRVPFRLIQTPCCSTLLCYVNPRLPNYCSEAIYSKIKRDASCILVSDENATLTTKRYQ